MYKPSGGFTLIELLVVVGIVAILATVVVLTLRPSELLKEARDSQRLSELVSLNKAVSLVLAQDSNLSTGSPNTVYVSLVDTATNCPNISSVLPALASGWFYHCTLNQDLRRADGGGWAPINFQGSGYSVLEKLPVDPVNNAASGLYYTYTPGYEFDAKMESVKYVSGGLNDKESIDGGDNASLFEVGTRLTALRLLTPDITFNSFSYGSTGSGGPAFSLAFNHTVNAGNNRILIVGISGSSYSTFGIQQVRYPDSGGTDLTKAVETYNDTTNYISSIWYLVNPPAVGTKTVYIQMSLSNANIVAGAVTLNNVDPVNPVDTSVSNAGTSAAASVSLITTSENDWIFDNLMKVYNASLPIVGSGQTSYWNSPSGNNVIVGAGSIKVAATPGATSTSWTFPSDAWLYTSVAFKKAQ